MKTSLATLRKNRLRWRSARSMALHRWNDPSIPLISSVSWPGKTMRDVMGAAVFQPLRRIMFPNFTYSATMRTEIN